MGRLSQGQRQQPPVGLRAGLLGSRTAVDDQSRHPDRSHHRVQQGPRRPGVLDQLDLPAHRLRVGRPGQQQDRRPRALRPLFRRREVQLLRPARSGDHTAVSRLLDPSLPHAASRRRCRTSIIDVIPDDPGNNRTMDSDIKHPRIRQAIVGVEHELVPRALGRRHRHLSQQRPVHRRRAAVQPREISGRSRSRIRGRTASPARGTKPPSA